MNSRERVFRALEFTGPDRAPRDFWALPWVSQYIQPRLDELLRKFPSDFMSAAALGKSARAAGVVARIGRYTDDWGSVFEVKQDGIVGEVVEPALANWGDLDDYQPPWEMLQHADFESVNKAVKANLASDNPRFLMGPTSLRPFERMQFLRGSENLYLDLGYEPAELFKLRDMVHDFYMKELAGWVKTDCDALTFMDDWGRQTALLIHPDQWRRIFKPLYRDYCGLMKAHGKKIFFHSDGCIFDIYPDLIELGMDAVNSQLFCMDIERIGRQYKGKITFWGEIDRQHILPFGTVSGVYQAVARVRSALDDGQGGLIAQCEWGVNNPPENIEAVYAAWAMPLSELLAKYPIASAHYPTPK